MIWAIWVPNSIALDLDSTSGNYSIDTDIYGIKWQLNYTELTVILDNRSDNDLTNIDIKLRTDLTIVSVAVAPGINSCTSGQIQTDGTHRTQSFRGISICRGAPNVRSVPLASRTCPLLLATRD
jgi:hypothetical protein